MKDSEPALTFSRSLGAEISLEDPTALEGEKDIPKPKANKKNMRVLSPTTEQLASLNLKEGRNSVTFTFSTAMLGKQQVICCCIAQLDFCLVIPILIISVLTLSNYFKG